MHPFGKVRVRNAPLPLKNVQNAPVHFVESGIHRMSLRRIACSLVDYSKNGPIARRNFNPIACGRGSLRVKRTEDTMLIGCPKEIKPQEYRVGLTPHAAAEAIAHGHDVIVEMGAGEGSGFTDDAYRAIGAGVVDTADEVFARADMVVKVKEPQAVERAKLREGQVLFTYLHLAPDPDQTRDLIDSGATAIAYETVTDRDGRLPLLAPMSEVAGKLAPQVGAWTLQKANGGRGVLMGGVPGSDPRRSSSSVVASSARRRRASPPAWGRM